MIVVLASLGQNCIMRKRERREKRGMTMNLIKIQVFTHASHVTKFSTERYTLAHVITALWQMWVASESLNTERTSWQILANMTMLTLLRWL